MDAGKLRFDSVGQADKIVVLRQCSSSGIAVDAAPSMFTLSIELTALAPGNRRSGDLSMKWHSIQAAFRPVAQASCKSFGQIFRNSVRNHYCIV